MLSTSKRLWVGNIVSSATLQWAGAVELDGTVVTPLRARRVRPGLNPFENALFLWEVAQQYGCTTYQMLLQTPLTLPAVGKLKQALAAVEM